MTGDRENMKARLKGLLPRSWFGLGETSVLDALMAGAAWVLSFVYDLVVYAKLQTRILTATDGWLDLVAADFFGADLARGQNQTDASFRARIIANLFRERATRAGLSRVIQELTGNPPVIIEPGRMADTGAWDQPPWAYDAAGSWAEPSLAYQAFVQVRMPAVSGIPYVGGWDVSVGAYDTASALAWTDESMVQETVTAEDVNAAIASVRPAATRIWVRFGYQPNTAALATESGDLLTSQAGTPFAV